MSLAGLEAVREHRDLDTGAKTAVQHRSEGLEGGVEAAAATATRAQSAQHAAQNGTDSQAASEAAVAQEALIPAEAAEATRAAAKLAGEASEAGEGTEAAARTAKAPARATEATGVEALLEASLIGVLRAEAAAGLLHTCLEARLVGVHARLNAAILGKTLLETGLERILAHLAHAREAAAHHLLHLGQLLLHLSQFLLHHSLLEASLERVLGSKLPGELTRESARLLHGEVIELLSVVAATMLLFSKKFAE